MLCQVVGKLVEIVGQLELATQGTETLRDGTATLYGHQPGDGAPRALDDDLLAGLCELYQTRELALGLVHPDADHGGKLPPT